MMMEPKKMTYLMKMTQMSQMKTLSMDKMTQNLTKSTRSEDAQFDPDFIVTCQNIRYSEVKCKQIIDYWFHGFHLHYGKS